MIATTILTTTLLASPELAAMEAQAEPYFVAAGHTDPALHDQRHNFAAFGVTHSNLYLGAAHIDDTSDKMGTRWQFYLGADLPVTDSISVSWRHLSNCSQICGWDQHMPNSGIDTLSLKREF